MYTTFLKIFSVEQVRKADAYTIKHEPIQSIDLMERAALACVNWLQDHIDLHRKIVVLCGTGNNGGDGLAIARLLILQKPSLDIEVWVAQRENTPSADFEQNVSRLIQQTPLKLNYLQDNSAFPDFPSNSLFIDALFGSGLSRRLDDWSGNWIEKINAKQFATVAAIDIPSGLFGDTATLSEKNIIKATHTLSFQFPKLSFLMCENTPFVGEFFILPIGLSDTYISATKTLYFLICEKGVHRLLKPRAKFAHKGDFGHALLIAGSYGKMGAAILASKACLRSGVGRLTTQLPKKGVEILQAVVPEAMVEIDEHEFFFSKVSENIQQFNAIGIGPGIGKDKLTQKAFYDLLEVWRKPLVLDADALNILSENPLWIDKIPKNSILTPHVREFERLIGEFNLTSFDLLEKQKDFSKKHDVIVVLKGAHTCISLPAGECFFNNNGNPGMATAGSGDVLTGIITAYLAQQYTPEEAAILGVFFHGKAGDKAKLIKGEQALIAGDIIHSL